MIFKFLLRNTNKYETYNTLFDEKTNSSQLRLYAT